MKRLEEVKQLKNGNAEMQNQRESEEKQKRQEKEENGVSQKPQQVIDTKISPPNSHLEKSSTQEQQQKEKQEKDAKSVTTCGGYEQCYILHSHWLKFPKT